MNETYDHKYKLGERVWIKSPDGIDIEVRIESVKIGDWWNYERNIKYTGIGGDEFYEDEVIDKNNGERLDENFSA